jgi:hypothetical protein
MTTDLDVKQTTPEHPPLRRTVTGKHGRYKIRATSSAHYRAETNDYAPFRLDGLVEVSLDGHSRFHANSSEIPAILEALQALQAAAEGDGL